MPKSLINIGTSYVHVMGTKTALENGAELKAAYVAGAVMTPNGNAKSAINRVTVIVSPGDYQFTSEFAINTPFVDVVSLTGNADVIILGSFTVNISANNVFIKGIDVLALEFKVQSSLPLTTLENCKGGDYSFSAYDTASGTFNYCTGGDNSFGGNGGSLTATVRLNYCKLTVGTFPTVAVGGKTRYCLDGNDATNNQG